MINRWLDSLWAQANMFYLPVRRRYWVDLLVLLAGAAVVFGMIQLGKEWTGVHRPAIVINLSPWALPQYTFFSMMRGLFAYAISLIFTLVYAFWAAKDHRAEKILIPLLDILQSIPVLGFMPGLVLALVAIFPRSNIGLEMAAVLMIFTGQAWNMTFSLYHSVKSVPADLQEAGTVYGFNWWQRFKWVELPYGTTGLVWNSMMSMAGGWFFLSVSESFQLGEHDFRLPGLGSYMSEAVNRGDTAAMVYAVIAMALMIVFLDQVLWRPVVVWAQRFRVEETAAAEEQRSWFLALLKRSRLLRRLRRSLAHRRENLRTARHARKAAPAAAPASANGEASASWVTLGALGLLVALLAFAGWKMVLEISHVEVRSWARLAGLGSLTLGRVLLATLLGTLWAVPVGLAIGLSPRLSKLLQPVVQVVASFPAPMLFPAVMLFLHLLNVPLNWGCILLMLLGTQWYILFNVIAGASSVPSDLREVADSFRLPRWQRFTALYLPAVFPYLVTGWVTAAGGAWNASIVAEYFNDKHGLQTADGLGAAVSLAAYNKDFPALAVSILLMSLIVVVFNRLVWRPLFDLAQTRYSLSK